MLQYTFQLLIKSPVTGGIPITLGTIFSPKGVLPHLQFEANSLIRQLYKRDVFFVADYSEEMQEIITNYTLFTDLQELNAPTGNRFTGTIMIFDGQSQGFLSYVENVTLVISSNIIS